MLSSLKLTQNQKTELQFIADCFKNCNTSRSTILEFNAALKLFSDKHNLEKKLIVKKENNNFLKIIEDETEKDKKIK